MRATLWTLSNVFAPRPPMEPSSIESAHVALRTALDATGDVTQGIVQDRKVCASDDKSSIQNKIGSVVSMGVRTEKKNWSWTLFP